MNASEAEKIIVATVRQLNRKWYESHPEYTMPEDDEFVDYHGNTNWFMVMETLEDEGEALVDSETHKVVLMETYGGGGQGDQYWFIYKIDDQYFKLSAYYTSWEGIHWNEAELFEVKPKEVTITQWVRA